MAGRIQTAVIAYLAGHSWPYEQRGAAVATAVVGRADNWPLFFESIEDHEQLLLYSILPVSVPAERRDAVMRYLTRANWGLILGSFELDLEDGEIRFRTSMDVEDAEITESLIDHLFQANVTVSDRYLPGLREVVAGADPDKAVTAVEASPG